MADFVICGERRSLCECIRERNHPPDFHECDPGCGGRWWYDADGDLVPIRFPSEVPGEGVPRDASWFDRVLSEPIVYHVTGFSGRSIDYRGMYPAVVVTGVPSDRPATASLLSQTVSDDGGDVVVRLPLTPAEVVTCRHLVGRGRARITLQRDPGTVEGLLYSIAEDPDIEEYRLQFLLRPPSRPQAARDVPAAPGTPGGEPGAGDGK